MPMKSAFPLDAPRLNPTQRIDSLPVLPTAGQIAVAPFTPDALLPENMPSVRDLMSAPPRRGVLPTRSGMTRPGWLNRWAVTSPFARGCPDSTLAPAAGSVVPHPRARTRFIDYRSTSRRTVLLKLRGWRKIPEPEICRDCPNWQLTGRWMSPTGSGPYCRSHARAHA